MLINHKARKLTEHIVIAHSDNHIGVYVVFVLIGEVILKTFQNSLSPAHHQIVGLLPLQLGSLLLHTAQQFQSLLLILR